MQKTTLEQWRMFKAVVDQGGFNQAASFIHKSTSSIHHAVSKLEDTLGVKLLVVQGRKTSLTPTGAVLLRRSEHLLDEVSRIEAVAESLSLGVESKLRIAVDGAFPQSMIYRALEAVSLRYPQVSIDIIDTVLSGTNELIAQGKADIGLSPFVMQSGLSEEVCLIEFVAVAHQDHPLNQLERPLTKQDLKAHRQIIVRDSATQKKANAGWLGAEQRWSVSHVRGSIDLIEQNLGYAWLPLPEIATSLKQGRIKRLNLTEGGGRSAGFYLNYLDDDRLGPTAQQFINELRLLTTHLPHN